MRTLLTISDHPSVDHAVDSVAVQIAATLQLAVHSLTQPQLADIDRIVDDTDAAMLVVGIRPSSRIQHYLNALRSLRIPYLFVKEQHTSFVPKTIILPVTNLLEDREKGLCILVGTPFQLDSQYYKT